MSRGMDQHLLKLAFSLRPDMTPRTLAEMSLGGGAFLLSLLFCTPLCYCEVWSVYSDSVVLLQDCVGEGRVLSLDDRHL